MRRHAVLDGIDLDDAAEDVVDLGEDETYLRGRL